MMKAAFWGKVEVAKLLIKEGADIKARDNNLVSARRLQGVRAKRAKERGRGARGRGSERRNRERTSQADGQGARGWLR